MLPRPKLRRVFLSQSADDGECRQLRLLGEPTLDRSNMRVELGRHANPGLIGPTGAPVRGTRLADHRRLAERLRERGCVAGAVLVQAGCRPRACPARRSTRLPSSSWVARISANSAPGSSEQY